MRISLIAAVADNGVIGRDGQLPWHLSDDLKRFKQRTMNHTVVMGRKTWESIGRPLPGRSIVVISRQTGYSAEGVRVLPSFNDAIQFAAGKADEEMFVCGGAEIYRLALPQADRLYLTRVHADCRGDTHFPDVCWEDWELTNSEAHAADEANDHPFTLEVFQRRA